MQSKVKNLNFKVKSFLEDIVERKRMELQKIRNTQKIGKSDSQVVRQSEALSFLEAFTEDNHKKVGLIAEVKFASPTNSHLGSPNDLLQQVKQYEHAGADAISIITEKHFFKGDVSFVSQVKKMVKVPVLQKDFVIAPQQIYEANEIGSDALLLIARLVDGKTLQRFVELCFAEGVEPVVEIANEEDLEKAVATTTHIIAVNARNLETFAVDVTKACLLLQKVPDKFITLGFSGINSSEDVREYKAAGAKGVLVGTSLMKTRNISRFIKGLTL